MQRKAMLFKLLPIITGSYSFSFWISAKSLHHLSLWLGRESETACFFSSFRYFKYVLCSLAWIVSKEKFTNCIFFLLYIYHFLLGLFLRFFSVSLVLTNLTMYLDIHSLLHVSSAWGSFTCSFLDLWIYSFHHTWKTVSCYFFKYFSAPTPSPRIPIILICWAMWTCPAAHGCSVYLCLFSVLFWVISIIIFSNSSHLFCSV